MKTVLKINEKPLLDEGKILVKDYAKVKELTNLEPTNVANYGYVQVVAEDLRPENIMLGKTILGVSGNVEDFSKQIIRRTIVSYNDNIGYIGSYAFAGCTNLTTVSLPQCSFVGSYAFYSCRSLTSISLPMCVRIGEYAFYECKKLESIYLNVSSVPTLGDNALAFTPLDSTPYGSIYVPYSLYEAFTQDPNWSYYSKRFVSYSF